MLCYYFQHFISQASDDIQELFRLHNSTSEEFRAVVKYFGEDPDKMDSSEIFSIFATFITKFEVGFCIEMLSALIDKHCMITYLVDFCGVLTLKALDHFLMTQSSLRRGEGGWTLPSNF